MVVRTDFASPLKDLLDEAPPSLDELLRVRVPTKRRVNVELRVVSSECSQRASGSSAEWGLRKRNAEFQTRDAERCQRPALTTL
jgi:hypothetical protein